jgi:alpha-D-xyloside xylohydrolase
VKEGSIIPVGPHLQFTLQKPAGTLSLYIYTGKNGSFTLYEDEDTSYNYEKGMYSNIRFDYNENEKTLIIQKRDGTFPGMLQKRIFNIIRIKKSNPVAFDFAQKYDEQVLYDGKKLSVKMK